MAIQPPPVAAALAAVAMLALVMNSYLRVGALAGDSWAFRKTLGEGQRVAYERPPAHMIHRLRESYGGAGTKVARPKPALTRAPLTRATLHCRLHSQLALSGCTAASASRYRRTQILRGQLATRNCRTFSTRTRSSGFRRGIRWAPRWGLCCAPFRYFAACIVPRAFGTWCSRSALRTPDDKATSVEENKAANDALRAAIDGLRPKPRAVLRWCVPVLRALPAARQHGHNSHTERPFPPTYCSLTSNPLTGLVEEGFAIMFDGICRGTDVEYAVAVLGRKYGRVSPGSRPSLRRWSF